jgi:two-component system, chemotaxis family, CheB/CheR fusion protein
MSQQPADEEDLPEEDGSSPTVVGIGASAGGLAALRTLLASVPEDSGLAWVVVVHLSPEHESHLAELLQPHVPFPVQQVAETVRLEPNRVYVIPPNANLNTIDTHLRLSDLEARRRERAPIDHFFRTLASTHDGKGIGVILTGTGSDGTLGLREIKEQGGLTIVQDPAEAEYDGMPQSAISTGIVDRVLRLADIVPAILGFVRTEPRVPAVVADEHVRDEELQLLLRVFGQIRARTGRDFTRYKRSTIIRRISRRMQLAQIALFSDYVARLQTDPDEVRALADDLLITVTSFFRDRDVFEWLESDVIPEILAHKTDGDAVRVWSVGCATGEEAYSIGILLLEALARAPDPPHIQVFASDLHEHSLAQARDGFYPGDIATDVSAERLARFFIEEDGGYRIRQEVRDLVVFSAHNLLSDPPFSRLDLISCRNVMIYLNRDIQEDVVEIFHYALGTDGFLLMGSSEKVESSELFQPRNLKNGVYRRRNVPAPEPRLPVFPLMRGGVHGRAARAEQSAQTGSYGALHQNVVERYGPPSLLLSADDRIVHLSANAGRYLVHPGGELTSNVFKLVRDELRIELRSAVHEARKQRQPVRGSPARVRFDGDYALVTVDVRPGADPDLEGYLLVVFTEESVEPAGPGRTNVDTRRARDLDDQVAIMKQRLQGLIEEYETGQEELRASNEELQSSNEELRSTLEELETSKEELQSMNEELQTVNEENRLKVEELSQLSGDLQNLLAATGIATLFLDRSLRILRFTPRVAELFSMRMADRGRPVSDLSHRLDYDGLIEDARSVLATLIPTEREIVDVDGNWFLTRLLPYRSHEDRIEGVVATFVDISGRKRAEEALRRSEERLRKMMNIEGAGVLTFGRDGTLLDANDAFLQMTGYSRAEVAAGLLHWRKLTPPEHLETTAREFDQAAQNGRIGPYEKEYQRRDGSRMWMRFVGADLGDGTIVEYCVDVSDRRRIEDDLRRLTETLEERVQERTHTLREREKQLVTARDALEAEVEERRRVQDAREDLMRRVMSAEEHERLRLSAELHDQMGQLITGLTLGLRALEEQGGEAATQRKLGELRGLAEQIGQEAHHIALSLRPPALDRLGLRASIEAYLDEWSDRHGIRTDFQAIGLDDQRFSNLVEIALYRVVQEGLTNIAKHARAHSVSVVLEFRDGTLRVMLEDDGNGFDTEATLLTALTGNRLGLLGMQERVQVLGGTMQVESVPNDGATLIVRLPAAPEDEQPVQDRP